MEFIDLKTQKERLASSIETNIAKVLEHGKFINGDEINEIESLLAEFIGAKNAIACGNGTDALQLALMALDLPQGAEVITTPFTFVATSEVISLLGFTPVFVDIDPDTYNIDANQIEEKITSNTAVILPVSLYGQCSDMDVINQIAEKYNLTVIEDAAQSFGAKYKNKYSGNLSKIATTSFFPSKPLGCYGDGGMVFTSDDEIAKKIKQIRNHGQAERYHHELVGVNSRLDTIQAAILLAKFSIFPQEIIDREKIGQRYSEKLMGFVKVPFVAEYTNHVYGQCTIEVENRGEFVNKMKNLGIPTSVHYPLPLHLQPAYKYLGYKKGDFPITENAANKVVSLPMHPYLDNKTQDRVVEGVIKCL